MSNQIPSGVISEDEAKLIMQPLVPSLLEGFWEAWDWVKAFVDRDELARLILHSSTMAGMISDAFGHFARPRLAEFKPRWSSNGRFQQAVIEQSVALRFKKLTPDLRSMNVRTESQRGVYEQDQALLANARPITALTWGYTLDAVGSDVTGIYVACPRDFYRNYWIWPVYQSGDGQIPLFGGSSLPPDAPVEGVLDVNITLKKRKAEIG